ncbi:hypothetical protein [Actinoplanes sp. NPDC051851]|uniref:YunG family protein n=1 Tax=Actinoplanes sp. NPDC051851 TaxID=3154753 RepID=UPI00343A59BD
MTRTDTALTVGMLEPILRAAWGRDTCDPHDLPHWHPANPERGQCGVTALVVQELIGGDLMLGEVFVGDDKVGHHWWNRLPDGTEIDLTAGQFFPTESVVGGEPHRPPADGPARCREQWTVLRDRVFAGLGRTREEAGAEAPAV